MDAQSKPSAKGIYRIRLLEHSPDLYMELVPGDKPSVKLNPLNASETKQQWVITPLDNDQYHIHSVFDNSGLVKSAESGLDGYGYPVPAASGTSATWVLTEGSFHIHKFSKITLLHESEELDCSHDKVSEKVVRFNKPDHDSVHQRWVFERVDIYNPPGPTAADRDLQRSFFQLTVDQAKLNEYDIIVIGTGIGGGIIASDLFETNSMLGKDAKSVLVIERGNLAFHSHCLNTARPSGLNEDRGQQNDTFFAKFRDNFNFSEEMNVDDWKGGPMYCLGGRSAAWGLFAPRVHDEILSRHFHPRVRHDLVSKYFREAETLMSLSLPTTKPIHQDLMERLNMAGDLGVQWQWGRIASEFRDDKNFDFASGAYSTIDKLLEIAMSKPKAPDGSDIEHANFKILLETEARALEFDDERKATGVVVRTPDGREETISLKTNGRVVLAAGSVASPAILLRSGVNLKKHGGLHLTDHDIFFKAQPFRYRVPHARQEVGTMKLQTYMRLEREERRR
ncbi:hypothetical protein EWM64_g5012 [Hericium alpestre]|uniref:Glucose-methanol-choline oxidoreductase N-terminal domain-containing protein n=1 Tax=Hericium alpestre TaxID=135208 RepID=A0A4Y9ZZP2_9AGAM|nr:hypothetical protein EWM64_g5012 [Hericium alpestre]